MSRLGYAVKTVSARPDHAQATQEALEKEIAQLKAQSRTSDKKEQMELAVLKKKVCLGFSIVIRDVNGFILGFFSNF